MAVGAARERCGKLGALVAGKFRREVVCALRCARLPRAPFGVNQGLMCGETTRRARCAQPAAVWRSGFGGLLG